MIITFKTKGLLGAVLVSLIFLLRPAPVHADTYDLFTLEGTSTGQLPYTPIFFTLSFQLPSTFLLSDVDSHGHLYYQGVPVTLNGVTSVQDSIGILYSYNGVLGMVFPDLDGSEFIFSTYIFSTTDGTTVTFTPEKDLPVGFSNTPPTAAIPFVGNANLTISPVPAALTPEPSSIALLATGLLCAGAVVRRRMI